MIIKKCTICNSEFKTYSKAVQCCSTVCTKKYRARNKVTVKCSICGFVQVRSKSKVIRSKTYICNSKQCRSTIIKKRQEGKNNSNYKGRVTLKTCIVCKTQFKDYVGDGRFCNLICKADWQHINLLGNANPFYGKHHTEENKRFFSKNNSKPLEKKINKALRDSNSMQKWRKQIYTRDAYTCQECAKVGGRLNAHHKTALATLIDTCTFTELYKKDRFAFIHHKYFYNIDNGTTVCWKCHMKEHKNLNIRYRNVS